jgi:hypothetical protein
MDAHIAAAASNPDKTFPTLAFIAELLLAFP